MCYCTAILAIFSKQRCSPIMWQNVFHFTQTVFLPYGGQSFPAVCQQFDSGYPKMATTILFPLDSYWKGRPMCPPAERVMSEGAMFCNTVWEEEDWWEHFWKKAAKRDFRETSCCILIVRFLFVQCLEDSGSRFDLFFCMPRRNGESWVRDCKCHMVFMGKCFVVQWLLWIRLCRSETC